MMRVNAKVQETLGVNLFTDDQLEQIYLASLEILERVGVTVYEERCKKLLKEAGARVVGDHVYIPSWMVQDALVTAPRKVTVADRLGQRAMLLQKNNIYYGTGSDLPNTFDLNTGERRKSVKQDTINFSVLSDALENIDFVMSMALASDVPTHSSDVHQFEAMVSNTTKPICFTAHDLQGLADIIEISEVVAGGEEQFRANPFIICYSQPSSPLKHSKDALEKVLLCAEKGVPLIYASAIMCGATGPMTQAGAFAMGTAEMLSGLVIHQLTAKGAPFIMGGGARAMNMRTMICPYGAPESEIGRLAVVKISQHLGLPSFSTAGTTDSQLFDQQAGMEAGFSILISGLGGGNLIHDLGYLGMGMTSSMEYLVLCNETAGAVKFFLNGVKVNEETLALDVIENVGPGGDFLGEEHTFRLFKGQSFNSKLLNRENYDNWVQQGSLSFKDKANAAVRDILDNHKAPALSEEVTNEIKGIISRRDQ